MDYPDSDAGLDTALAAWLQEPGGADTYRQDISFQGPGAAPGAVEPLAAEYRFARGERGVSVDASLGGQSVSLDVPVRLESVSIPKPCLLYTSPSPRDS